MRFGYSVGVTTAGAAKAGSWDNNVAVILFGNNWILSNLILTQKKKL